MPREVSQDLSPREDEILDLAAQGFTDIAIAHKLGISEGTVGTYWGRIRTKIGPYPRTELIALRVRSQLQAKLDNISRDRDLLEALLHSTSDAERLYEDVLDQTAEGVVVVNGEGIIEHANPAAHQMFKYELGTLRSMQLATLVPERLRREHTGKFFAYCSQHQKGQSSFRVATFAQDQSGSEFPVTITVASVHRGDELLLTGLFEPRPEPDQTHFRVAVRDLERLGMPAASALDRNQDGWVDDEEIRNALESNGPETKPKSTDQTA